MYRCVLARFVRTRHQGARGWRWRIREPGPVVAKRSTQHRHDNSGLYTASTVSVWKSKHGRWDRSARFHDDTTSLSFLAEVDRPHRLERRLQHRSDRKSTRLNSS